MAIPLKTGTDGALVVPLTPRWNKNGIAAPEQGKAANLLYPQVFHTIDTVPIYPTVQTIPMGNPTSARTTVINPMDFMRGNPYE